MRIATKWSDVPNPVRNTGQEYLKFLNTRVFSEEAHRFLENKRRTGVGYYIDPRASKREKREYWLNQLERIIHGYEVGGVRITGRHYFYLNFSYIHCFKLNPATGEEDVNSSKIWTFPRFLDHNYYLFHELEKIFLEGPYAKMSESERKKLGVKKQSMIIAKSRRKGMTFAVGEGVYVYNFLFLEGSVNTVAAYESSHYAMLVKAFNTGISHANQYTEIGQPLLVNTKTHKRSGVQKVNKETGAPYEDGHLSEFKASSFKGDAFKDIGASNTVVSFEEAGKFPNLIQAYNITEPTIKTGSYYSGVALIFGTGGDIEAGSKDFAKMYYNPEGWDLKSYENIYDENATGNCGFFIDDLWYRPGKRNDEYAVDLEGNSNRVVAYEMWKDLWEKKKDADEGSAKDHLTQYPLTPAHAFLRTRGNLFDAIRAQERISHLMTNPRELDSHYIVDLIFDPSAPNTVTWKKSADAPIREYPISSNRINGAVEIFDMPQKIGGVLRDNRYIAGIDPYDSDQTLDGKGSLGSCFVFDLYKDKIVAEYTGRPSRAKHFYENVRRLLIFYNAIALYERANKNIYTYFQRMNSLKYLADEPNFLRERGFSKGRGVGNLSKGFHPTKETNKLGRELYDDWTREPAYGEDAESEVVNMDKISSLGLLKETASWSPDANADRISAMVGLFIYRESLKNFIQDDSEDVDDMVNDYFIKSILGMNQI